VNWKGAKPSMASKWKGAKQIAYLLRLSFSTRLTSKPSMATRKSSS
jgi:hypothetical protein